MYDAIALMVVAKLNVVLWPVIFSHSLVDRRSKPLRVDITLRFDLVFQVEVIRLAEDWTPLDKNKISFT